MESKSLQERTEYVRELLSLNPETDAQRIISLRSTFLALESTATNRVQALNREAIGSLKNLLDYCSRSFWKTGIDDVGSILASEQFNNAMEASTGAERMLRWHRLRDRIYELREVLGRYSLAMEVHRLAPMRTREAEGFKYQVLRSIQQGNSRSYRDDAKAIKAKFPEIYALEPDWFEDIIHSKRPRWFSRGGQGAGAAISEASEGYRFPTWLIFLLVIFAIKSIIAMSLAKR